MFHQRLLYKLLFLLPLSISTITNAAELRGRLTGISGVEVSVNCNGSGSSSTVGNNGSYKVTDLPSGKGCSFIVSQGTTTKSAEIPFNTSRSVTIYNGKLRKRGNRILVIRQ